MFRVAVDRSGRLYYQRTISVNSPETISRGCSRSVEELLFLIGRNRRFITSEGHRGILRERMNHYERTKSWLWIRVRLFCSFIAPMGTRAISYEVSLPKVLEALTKYLKRMIQRCTSVHWTKQAFAEIHMRNPPNVKRKVVKIKRK